MPSVYMQIKLALHEATYGNRRSTNCNWAVAEFVHCIFELGIYLISRPVIRPFFLAYTGTRQFYCNILIVVFFKFVATMPGNLGSWFGPTVSTVITPLKDVFFTHAMYCFNTGKNVRDHNRATKTLIGIQKGVQGEIEAGIQNGLMATNEANFWLERANKAISEEERNHQLYDNRCAIFACCSLNCWANYKIGKRAAEKLPDVDACVNNIPRNVTENRPPPFVIDIPVQFAQLPSHEKVLLSAQKCIEDDRVGMIGLWGPDGTENTHLLRKINNSFIGDSTYFVIFVTASKECSVDKIQDQIIQRLEIGLYDDVACKASNLSKLLRTRNFLVLVDDLYEKLDLLEVGIPFPLGIVGELKRKVVITSRSETVCNQMDVSKYIEVPALEEIEARMLFAQTLGQEDIDSDPQIGPLANDLLKELKGLPSYLIHFGKLMLGKSNPEEWEDVIRTVKKSNLQQKDPILARRTFRNLEDASNNLVARSNDVRRRIEAAERECMTSTNEVDRWLVKTATINSDVQIIFEGNKLKKDVTMEAIEKLSEVQECLRACPEIVAVESLSPPTQEIPGPSMSLSSDNHNLQKALQFISDDPVGMIGIWGPGGVGKTYLLNNINNSIAAARGMCFNVIFVTASKGCSVESIQGDFLKKLGMKENGDVESRRQKICNFLKNRSFLVLLDDLWDEIDLQAVGVPYPLGIVNQFKRKVVLTTRLRKVLGEMEVRQELKVACLQEDEAWQLFQEKVGQETLSSSPRIEALARELVNELKGLPLALTVIGRAMYGKEDPSRWESAVRHMQLSRCEKDDREPMTKIFKQLKFSYDCLRNNTLRNSFLTCALWPEDWKIPKVELARSWMGLGLLVTEDDITSSYRKSYSIIGDLRDASLLDSWGNWYGYVKVHDVIRDMALWISCGCGDDNDKWFVRARVDKHENLSIRWSKAEYISLMQNKIQNFTPSNFDPCLVNLRMLCLQSNSIGLAESIAQTIENFTSLKYLDLSRNRLKSIPDELCSLVNLEHLNLSHNHLIQMPHCFRNLIKLKFLYLLSSGIVRIPKGVILNLKALEVIDLRTCQESGGGGPGNCNPAVFRELSALAHLKAANIEASGFVEYESLSGAANLPIRSLSLMGLHGRPSFCFSDISSLGFVQGTLYELDILLSTMELFIVRGELAQLDYHFPTLNKIFLFMLPNLKEIMWMGRSPHCVFPRLTYLHVGCCAKLEHVSWVIYLPCLEQLEINFCRSMKRAIVEPIQHGTFPCLKHLLLSHNSELVTIGDRDVMFPSLERLVIHDCPKLEGPPFHKHSLPLKLRELQFDKVEYWEKLEWEEGVKSFLQPTLKFGDEGVQSISIPPPSTRRYGFRATPAESRNQKPPKPFWNSLHDLMETAEPARKLRFSKTQPQ
ncbi:probable disease resistance protein At1g61300 [Triticum dicoccoides]|uniref:probable disease resistance protein At1g61300 n=1 Tax=Triticum dicoccoides TaxID=85692 RepID=UPI0018907619|nr:probable disease resistance protein At1g61300 [Triticum dicoccoides]